MAFLVPSLGSFIQHIWLLLFIPRVAGSLRVLRLSASELNTSFEQPGVSFLSTSVPGLFLDFDIPTNASLVRVYGHKYGGASLYGVCLGCRGAFEVIDGHKPSLQTPFESAPSCLFSLALNGQEGRSLELHNLYDHRFDTHGKITFAFIEYIFGNQGGSQASDGEVLVCRNNLSWSRPKHTLARRINAQATTPAPPIPQTPAPSISQTPPSHSLGDKMDAMIGLIAALITIILVIFLVSAYYILHLRRQEAKQRHPEQGLENNTNSNPTTKSTMISSATAALDQDSQPRDKVEILLKDRYITDQEEMTLWNSTPPPLPPKAYVARADRSPIQTQTVQADMTTPSINRLQPRSRPEPLGPPPREPVPDVPKPPEAAVARPYKGGNAMTSTVNPDSPARLRGQMNSPSSRLNIDKSLPQDDRRVGGNISDRTLPSHSRSQSGTDSSATSHESRPRAPLSSLPSRDTSLPRSIPSTEGIGRLAKSNEERARLKRLDTSGRYAGDPTQMRTIREPDLSNTSPQPPAQTTPITLGHTRSASDIQQGTRLRPLPKIRTLRESKSSPDLEDGESMDGIRMGAAAQPSRIPIRGPLKQNVRQVEPLRTPRASSHSRKNGYSQTEPRISIKIPPDPLDWLTPSTEAPTLPSPAQPASPKNRLPQHITGRPAGRPEESQSSKRSAARLPSLLPPPQYEQLTAPSERGLSFETPVITPLVPRKRALPKPPI
ncbi:hypothetical protein P691DRAFT_770006 [Macrolepiota fuliginosa MF-IS2]|uniref:Uncharacterized protein n=1 Tax=Macrolepiota fuliginosa MF-IS2 TaxID=1400762 RepID=A0A9P6C7K6_9AGAR|nr:hypothetical protein P691DRAFT_770006 [Macrolepiota fuliginosa MF-IS2]